MGLDGAFCRTKLTSDLLVFLSPNYKLKDLSLARRQRQKASAEHIVIGL
jgi:hypothetical protein